MVIHLAAQVHVMGELSRDIQAGFQVINTHGTERLAKEAAKRSVKRFIYMSSIKVNVKGSSLLPSNEPVILTAGDKPEPGEPYAISKYQTELRLMSLAKDTGMEYVILRPPLIYGPDVRANFQKLLNAVHRGHPLPLASIKNIRSLIYVKNLNNIILTCLEHPTAADKIFLVKDIDVSTPDLIRVIAKNMSKAVRLFPVPVSLLKFGGKLTGKLSTIERLTDSLVVDDAPLRQELQWLPPYTFEEGIIDTVKWYQNKA